MDYRKPKSPERVIRSVEYTAEHFIGSEYTTERVIGSEHTAEHFIGSEHTTEHFIKSVKYTAKHVIESVDSEHDDEHDDEYDNEHDSVHDDEQESEHDDEQESEHDDEHVEQTNIKKKIVAPPLCHGFKLSANPNSGLKIDHKTVVNDFLRKKIKKDPIAELRRKLYEKTPQFKKHSIRGKKGHITKKRKELVNQIAINERQLDQLQSATASFNLIKEKIVEMKKRLKNVINELNELNELENLSTAL
jgi:hypothetical protein